MSTPKRDERTAVADTSTHAAGITSHPQSQTRLDGYARVAGLPRSWPRSCTRDAVFELVREAQYLNAEIGEVLRPLDGGFTSDKRLDEDGRRLHAMALDLAAFARKLRAARYLIWIGGEP